MKFTSPYKTSPIATLLITLLASPLVSNATTPNSATLSNYTNSGYLIYRDTGAGNPSELAQTFDLGEAVNALSGDATYAGGNIELYTASDGASMANFANADRVSLTVDFGAGNQVNLSSLNGQDWFNDGLSYNTSYGANNLANQWFGDLVGELSNVSASQEVQLFNTFVGAGGFQQLSDPNVSYVEKNGNEVKVGLGGFIDVKQRFLQLAVASGIDPVTANTTVPDGLQVSEVVIIDGVASYGFSATDSGVRYDDGVDSYNANYEVSNVPEPSSTILSITGLLALSLRRKRS